MHKKTKPELNVAVLMLSYNSEEYIEEAIDSFLNQKGIKNWKLYIADDFSTDNTRKIILKYKQSFPERVDYLFNEKNLGIARNLFTNYLKLNSKYCVYAAADDILEDQFFLRDCCLILNKDKTLSFTYAGGQSFSKNKNEKKDSLYPVPVVNPFDFNHWSKNGFFRINVTALMFRTSKYPLKFENWVLNFIPEDFIHWVMLLEKGKGFYQDKKSSLYRNHIQSVTKKEKQQQLKSIYNKYNSMKDLNNYFIKTHKNHVFSGFKEFHRQISILSFEKMLYKQGIIFSFKYFLERPGFTITILHIKNIVKSIINGFGKTFFNRVS